jgi:hypothetical protein
MLIDCAERKRLVVLREKFGKNRGSERPLYTEAV